jgi:hypothetical protein
MPKKYLYQFDQLANTLLAPTGRALKLKSSNSFWDAQEFVKELNDTLIKLHERKSKHNVKSKR